MSNALRRNKKPAFYTKQEMRIIGRNDFEKRNADKVISKSYKDFVVIGYIILHDRTIRERKIKNVARKDFYNNRCQFKQN
jgi:hypothetical protein